MKILLVGSGGREHSLAYKIVNSPLCARLFIAPGNAGTADLGQNVPISENNINKLKDFALHEKIDLTIVGPEAALVAGIADLFEAHGLRIVGPYQNGACLEGSKKWAKELMRKNGIPTANFEVFEQYSPACQYLEKAAYPLVIKADGLAAGKGVTIAKTREEALQALNECFIKNSFGEAGQTVVIEEFLTGEEASIFAFTDGLHFLQTESAQDHKTIFDGDQGPNTGGMGAYSPAPIVTSKVAKKVHDKIFTPLLKALKNEGIVYKGIIFAGLMIKDEEPYVIEFNARFGDPETQVLLPRLENDIVELFLAIAERRLNKIKLSWRPEAAACVVLTAGGYPGNYEKNRVITGLNNPTKQPTVQVILAGTKKNEQKQLVTCGGRVLGVVSWNLDLAKALKTIYQTIDTIHFEQMHYRKDIGAKAIAKNQ